MLTGALRRMRDSLKMHVQMRAESIAAQARLEHELKIAASIQQSMLPRLESVRLPPGIAVAAALVPARRVGGDLYDYFMLRDGRMLFAIGDVSDKGIPAALFMARVSGLIRVLGSAGEPPESILAELNRQLVEGNDACMFVTLGCGTLDPRDGRLRYASAGHEAPLVCRSNGEVVHAADAQWPRDRYRLAGGISCDRDRIAPGDTLVLFTDGVSEAAAEDGMLFGVDRLGKLLAQVAGDTPERLVRRVADSLMDGPEDFTWTTTWR